MSSFKLYSFLPHLFPPFKELFKKLTRFHLYFKSTQLNPIPHPQTLQVLMSEILHKFITLLNTLPNPHPLFNRVQHSINKLLYRQLSVSILIFLLKVHKIKSLFRECNLDKGHYDQTKSHY